MYLCVHYQSKVRCFFKEINTLNQQGCIQLFKVAVKAFIFKINYVLLNFLFIKECWEKIFSTLFTFIITKLLEHQIIIFEGFLKDHVTQDWSNKKAENSTLPFHIMNYILK